MVGDAGEIELTGDATKLHDLLGPLDTFGFWFNIVTP